MTRRKKTPAPKDEQVIETAEGMRRSRVSWANLKDPLVIVERRPSNRPLVPPPNTPCLDSIFGTGTYQPVTVSVPDPQDPDRTTTVTQYRCDHCGHSWSESSLHDLTPVKRSQVLPTDTIVEF